MLKTRTILGVAAASVLALTAYALEGKNGTTVTQLFTQGTVKSSISWTQDDFRLGVPWRDGAEVASNSSGEIFFVVHGSGAVDPWPMSTGLIRYDGTNYTELIEYVQNQGTGPHTGKLIRMVAVAPSSGHPHLLLHNTTENPDGTLSYSVDLVIIDPWSAPATETLVWSFGTQAADATVVVDADDTIYVGPMSDGSITRIGSDGTVVADFVPGFDAGGGLTIDTSGNLYTFGQGTIWNVAPTDDKEIFKIDPATRNVASLAFVDGRSFIFDWAWSNGRLWVGARDTKTKGKRAPLRYVAEVVPGSIAGPSNAIADSGQDPKTVAAIGDGDLLVLESGPGIDDALYLVTPGSGDGGGGGGKGGGKGKNK